MAKGSKNLAGGRRLHLIVAIVYGKGVVLKEAYEKRNGRFFTQFIQEHFNDLGQKGTENDFSLWTMIPVNGVRSQRGPLRT